MAKSKSTKKRPAKAKKIAKGKAAESPPVAPKESSKPSAFLDDPRLPAVGTVIERVYKGQTYRVERTATDFLYGGRSYRSLSAVASEILGGVSVNGFLWFGLQPRSAPKPKPAGEKKPSAPDANDLATPAGQRRAQERMLAPKRSKAKRSVDTSVADAQPSDDAQDAPSAD